MSCILTNGIGLGCLDSTGGIKSIFIANFNATGTTFSADTEGIITGMTSSETFFEYNFRKQTSSFAEEGTLSVENGTNFYIPTVTMVFHKLESTKRNAVLLLAKADTHVIVQTQNDDYWIAGKVNAMNLTTTSVATGLSFGDLNGYTIALTGAEPELAQEISAAAFATLSTSS